MSDYRRTYGLVAISQLFIIEITAIYYTKPEFIVRFEKIQWKFPLW